jgi:hypothetical protein
MDRVDHEAALGYRCRNRDCGHYIPDQEALDAELPRIPLASLTFREDGRPLLGREAPKFSILDASSTPPILHAAPAPRILDANAPAIGYADVTYKYPSSGSRVSFSSRPILPTDVPGTYKVAMAEEQKTRKLEILSMHVRLVPEMDKVGFAYITNLQQGLIQLQEWTSGKSFVPGTVTVTGIDYAAPPSLISEGDIENLDDEIRASMISAFAGFSDLDVEDDELQAQLEPEITALLNRVKALHSEKKQPAPSAKVEYNCVPFFDLLKIQIDPNLPRNQLWFSRDLTKVYDEAKAAELFQSAFRDFARPLVLLKEPKETVPEAITRISAEILKGKK